MLRYLELIQNPHRFLALTGYTVRSCFKIIKLDFSVGYVFYKVPID
jgi:hypothetical protein